MASIDCPDTYAAFLVDSYTQETLLELPWQQIKWQRISNEVSEAQIIVGQADRGIECTANLISGLFPWVQMLMIERNGTPVWDGPLMGWSRPSGSYDLTIKARDRSAIFWKRLVRTHRTFVGPGLTPPAIIQTLIADGLIGNLTYDPYALTIVPPTTPTEIVQREYLPERLERIYDVIKELVDNSYTGFWTTVLDQVYLNELDVAGMLGIFTSGTGPSLSDETVLGHPGIDVDGSGMSTTVYTGGAAEGTNGFPQIVSITQHLFINATLEKSAPQDRSATTADLLRIAGREAAASARPGVTLEQFALAPTFGSENFRPNFANMLPGSQYPLDFTETVAFDIPISEYRETAGVPGIAYTSRIAGLRLDQLDVTVTRSGSDGVKEEVIGSFRPIVTGDPASQVGELVQSDVGSDGSSSYPDDRHPGGPDEDCGLDGSLCSGGGP